MYKYAITKNGDFFSYKGKEISLVFTCDGEEIILQKHGNKESIENWSKDFKNKMNAAGFNQIADGLQIITGQFPLDEINWLLDCTSYAKTFYEKVMSCKMHIEPSLKINS